MKVLAKNRILSPGRVLFVDKKTCAKDQLEIESTGSYRVEENENCYLIKNTDCCRNIMVTVKVRNE